MTDEHNPKARKHFVSVISQQVSGNLKRVPYIAIDNNEISYKQPVHFPIVPLIAAFVNAEDHFTLTTIMALGDSEDKNRNISENHQILIDEIEEIQTNSNISFSFDENVIYTPYDSNPLSLVELTNAVVSEVQAGDSLFVCMTYGEKPDTLALYQALLEIFTNSRATLDVSIELLIYGQYTQNAPHGTIRDITNFVKRGVWLDAAAWVETTTLETNDIKPTNLTKHYLTVMPPNANIKSAQWHNEHTDQAIYIPVVFPIIPILAQSIAEGDEILVSTIVFDSTDNEQVLEAMERNQTILQAEINEVRRQSGIDFTWRTEVINTPYNSTNSTLNQLCDNIKASISEGDSLYVCLTFGLKTITIAIQQAISEVLAQKPWLIDIAYCVYGNQLWGTTEPPRLKNITTFVYNQVMELILRRSNRRDSKAIREILLSIKAEDDEDE